MAEVIVIGSGTGVPSLRRGSPGILILAGSTKILIDSGPGALRKMLEVGITYRDMDLILYTHLHPDHIADLVAILFASKYGDLPREKDLLCAGGAGFKSYFEKLRNLYGSWIESKSYQLAVKELSIDPLHYRGVKVLAKPMAHLPSSMGYRMEFEDGKAVAISGDTDYCQNLVELGDHVDLLVLECSFPDGKKTEGHLTPSLAGRIASESQCKRVLLIHLYPICDEFDIVHQCRQAYQGNIILGEDLMKIPI